MPRLVLPATKYKNSFLAAVREYQAEKQKNYLDLDIERIKNNFDAFIAQIRGEARGIGLPTGYVPRTVFWLVEDSTYLGRVDIRHSLNEFLSEEGGHIGYDIRPTFRKQGFGTLALRLAIAKAKQLGIKKILVTCDIDNIGSNKIIIKNGGILSHSDPSVSSVVKNKYWI